MEFGMTRRIKPKEKYVWISLKEIWCHLDRLPKNKELWSYVEKFEFNRPKSSSDMEAVLPLNTSFILSYPEICF